MNYIGLLRGINVGGHKTIAMEDLREMCEGLGLQDVQTYIQSGNILFSTDETDITRLVDMISHAVSTKFKLDVDVQIRTADEWKQIITLCPYAQAGQDVNDVYVTLLATPPVKVAIQDLTDGLTESENYILKDQTLYLRTPAYGTTKLSNAMIERKLKSSATTRNWKTIVKIGEMIDL